MTAGFRTAVIIGAGGGIGSALVIALSEQSDCEAIHAFSRQITAQAIPRVRADVIDVTDEETIRSAAAAVNRPVDLVIVATGLLHDAEGTPERSLRDLDQAKLARVFAVNTIGPALVLKHFAPLLARDRRSVFALLSARVGSISDNRSGGWYGYRSSKAALNMIIRSAAIELSHSRPYSICVGLHPGTVDTALSKPFQANVPDGKLFAPKIAAEQMLKVIHGLETGDSGKCWAWDGSVIDP